MNKFLLLGFAALFFCTVAQGLLCKVCSFKVGALCFSSDKPCIAKEGQHCENTEVYSGKLMFFTRQDCNHHRELCNMTEQRDNIFDVSYNRTCCNHEDFCNGGIVSDPSLPLIAGLSLVLGSWLAH
ncbi:lymphocyte antigen 6 complex locus protein G6c-like [Paroedura picta]|uniref:lymphocyte antigen 6 complex locus protein G6c-like n=1 Tax=Paroedura picta TaxID=143630 RepID=UPI0040572B03